MEHLPVIILLGVSALLLVAIFLFALRYFRIWVRALLSGVPVQLTEILGMHLRGNPPGLLVDAYLALKHRGADVSLRDIEHVYIARKDLDYSASELADEVQHTCTLQP